MKHLIDTNKEPKIPNGYNWTVESHKGMGKIDWSDMGVDLYISEKQKDGRVVGTDLQKELEGKSVLNSNVLDYLLDNQELIPKSWRGKYIFFWGTIFRNSDGSLCVRYLCVYADGSCYWGYFYLGYHFRSDDPAAVASKSTLNSEPLNFEIETILVNGKRYKLVD